MASEFKLIFGGFTLPALPEEEQLAVYDVLDKYGIAAIDTAYIYPGSEKQLGDTKAASRFEIHTKAPGFGPGSLTRDSILSGIEKSFKELQVDSVDLYYFHSPDHTSSISESLDTIQELYKQGKFRRFGLSNFTPEDVQKIYDYNKEKGYVLPTVYQGNFNPVARHLEKDLLPVLRKLGISVYAYSPLAGGFLAKTANEITNGVGRWDPTTQIGALYHGLYNRPSLLKALDEWDAISKDSGISKSALAYRWDVYNSVLSAEYGDGIIIGGRTKEQLEETLKNIKAGPLPDSIAKRISAIWESVKDEAPVDNFTK